MSKKKTEKIEIEATSNSKTNKKTKKEPVVITAPNLEVTNTDIEKVERYTKEEKEIVKENGSFVSINNNEFIGEKPVTKSKKKYYEDAHSVWDCERIILRINGKDYIRQFPMVVSISKNKLGKLTVYGKNKDKTNKWGKIQQIIQESTDLIFEVEPINI